MDTSQILLILVRIVNEYLQRVPYWWNLPIVLMMLYQLQQREHLMQNNLFDSYPDDVSLSLKHDCLDPVIGKLKQ